MENDQIEFTVEYQDSNGVLYFENIKASNLSDAKMQVRQRFPDVNIRAVTIVPHDNGDEPDPFAASLLL
ncbi:hypothetical protein [Paenibacillus fonticola]|uniref:hypothetical protein n=1 Tax=Paenibacillus fonticola TaxID=379896 RepID=UPI00036FFFE2|nr:hypothetical protein [Paenibacillus fonticola]